MIIITTLSSFSVFDWLFSSTSHVEGTIAIVSALVSLSVALFIIFRKNKGDAFESIIQANEKFRNEVRNDLIICKADVERYKKLLQDLEIEDKKHREEIASLKQKLDAAEKRISEYELAISSCDFAQCKRVALRIRAEKGDSK